VTARIRSLRRGSGRALKAWAEAGLDPISLHEARHTYASIMIDAGANAKAISTYMWVTRRSRSPTTATGSSCRATDQVRALLDAYLGAG
jgi:integrase